MNGGTIAGWVGVQSNAQDSQGPLNWFQVGLARESNGGALRFYMEDRVNGGTPQYPIGDPVLGAPLAQESTQYQFLITHDSSSTWTAKIKTYPGQVLLYSVTKSVSVDNQAITGETLDASGSSCNTMNFAFWGTPFPTGQPNDQYEDNSTRPLGRTNPYWIGLGSNGNDFQAVGP